MVLCNERPSRFEVHAVVSEPTELHTDKQWSQQPLKNVGICLLRGLADKHMLLTSLILWPVVKHCGISFWVCRGISSYTTCPSPSCIEVPGMAQQFLATASCLLQCACSNHWHAAPAAEHKGDAYHPPPLPLPTFLSPSHGWATNTPLHT